MEPLPRRMRERIVALYEQGLPTRRIADVLGTSRSGTRRIRQNLRERGTLEPARARTGYASGLTPEVAERLRELVAAEPGATRAVLRERLGVTADVRTIGRWLAKLGLVLKKSRSAPRSRTGPM
ncbi:MAG: helix-turn-helix domain-containing protein [Tepidisphaeraceae bacterium]